MSSITWTDDLATDVAPGSSPSTTRDITNSINGESYDAVCFTFSPTGGTDPTAELELYIWDGTQYVRTGDSWVLNPAARNYLEIPARTYMAFDVTVSGAPTPWAVKYGVIAE